MKILRTPDDAADGLVDYPSERGYAEIPAGDGQKLRVHLVDANPPGSSTNAPDSSDAEPDAPVVVFLHGNPSWSYIWRHQIAAVAGAGYRAIAPDLVGMGLSDKPSEMADYTVARHIEWMRSLLFDDLDLHDVSFVSWLGWHRRYASRGRAPGPRCSHGDLEHRPALA